MNVFQIDKAIEDCINEDGEIFDIERFEALEMERRTKIENALLLLKNIRAEKEAVANQKSIFEARRKTLENREDSLVSFLTAYLDGEKFKTERVSTYFRGSTSVSADVEQIKLMENCDDFLRYSEPEPNKEAIKNALEKGIKVNGCKLVTKQSLIVR